MGRRKERRREDGLEELRMRGKRGLEGFKVGRINGDQEADPCQPEAVGLTEALSSTEQ